MHGNVIPIDRNPFPVDRRVIPIERNDAPIDGEFTPVNGNVGPMHGTVAPIDGNVIPLEPNAAAAARSRYNEGVDERFRMLMRHYATEGLFVLGLLPVCLAVFWLGKHFAWAERTVSTAIIVWTICWLVVVWSSGDRIIDGIVGLVSRRTKVR